MFQWTVAPGLEMRLFQAEDAEAVFAIVERNRRHLREWLPWIDRTRSARDIRVFIEEVVLPQYAASQGPQAAIWLEGGICGSVGCHPIDWANRHCSLGYWIDAAQQGKGIVTRCCAAMLDYLFRDAGLHRVTIQCGTGNLRSCAIPQRLGFTREGVLREAEWVNDRWVDLVLWRMLAQEWKKL